MVDESDLVRVRSACDLLVLPLIQACKYPVAQSYMGVGLSEARAVI